MDRLVLIGPWNNSRTILPTSIVAAVAHVPPFTYVEENNGLAFSGYLVDLMRMLGEQLRIPVHFTASTEIKTASRFNDSSDRSELVDMLVKEEADVALAPFSWTEQHLEKVDYVGRTPVAYSDHGFFVLGSQESAMDSLTALTAPFHYDVWISLVVSIFISAVVLRFTNPTSSGWRGSDFEQANVKDNVDDMKWTWISSLLSVFACVTQQAWPATPYPLSARIVTITVRIMALIIYVQYTASLILILTQTEVASEVKSVENFYQRSDWTLLVEPSDERVQSWQTSTDSLLRSLYTRIQNQDRVDFFNPKSVKKLLSPKAVTFYDSKLAFFGLEGKACDLVPLRLHENEEINMERDRTGGKPLFLIMRKNSPFQNILSTTMQKLFESGSLDRLSRYWFFNTTVYNCEKEAGYSSLAFVDLSAVLYLLLSGILASMVVLMTENLHFHATKLANNVKKHTEVKATVTFLQ